MRCPVSSNELRLAEIFQFTHVALILKIRIDDIAFVLVNEIDERPQPFAHRVEHARHDVVPAFVLVEVVDDIQRRLDQATCAPPGDPWRTRR